MSRLRRLHLPARLTAALLLLTVLAQPSASLALAAPVAPAAPQGGCLIVTTTNDTGPGSLRAAVACATSGQTVTASFALQANSTITLTSGQIAITQSITIDGSNSAGLKIDGNSNGRIFDISAAGPVTLTALTLQHGSTSDNGGAINAGAASPLVLSQVSVLSNTSTANEGGGIYSLAPVSLTGGVVQNNTCQWASCYGGGVIAYASVTLANVQFRNNHSNSGAGGLYAGGDVSVTNSLFQLNSCQAADCSGGGLSATGTGVISATQFLTNTSTDHSGGLKVYGALTITNGLFQGNSCSEVNCYGGGLWTAGRLKLTNVDFTGNTSQDSGGGAVYADAHAVVINGLFQGNSCAGANCSGGALHADTLVLTGTHFLTNTSTGSGGALFVASNLVALAGARLQGNACTAAACQGGGLYADNTITLSNTDFISNTSGGKGGGVYAGYDLLLTGGRFEKNVCTQAACSGGALYVSGSADFTGGVFERNACLGAGCLGGAARLAYSLDLTGTAFLSNTSQGSGGALNITAQSNLANFTIQGNACLAAGCEGGGVYGADDLNLRSGTLSGNQSAGLGGGVVITDAGNSYVVNITISGNTAQTGGGLYIGGTSGVNLLNITVADNVAPSGGGLATGPLTNVYLVNTLFDNNGAATCAGPLGNGDDNLEYPGSTCATAGPTADFTTDDPLLAPLALNAPGTTQTHALLAGSPARDAGDATTCGDVDVNNLDQRGVTRPIDSDNVPGAVCDIGAYEADVSAWLLYLPLILR